MNLPAAAGRERLRAGLDRAALARINNADATGQFLARPWRTNGLGVAHQILVENLADAMVQVRCSRALMARADQRPPHAAKVAAKSGILLGDLPPHAARVVQRRAPHAATVAQPRKSLAPVLSRAVAIQRMDGPPLDPPENKRLEPRTPGSQIEPQALVAHFAKFPGIAEFGLLSQASYFWQTFSEDDPKSWHPVVELAKELLSSALLAAHTVDAYMSLASALCQIEQKIGEETKGTEDEYLAYLGWRNALCLLLDERPLHRLLATLLKGGAVLDGDSGITCSASQNVMRPLTALPGSTYARLNRGLRSSNVETKFALFYSCTILVDFGERAFVATSERVRHLSGTLFDGTTDTDILVPGKPLMDLGWTFFGKRANVSTANRLFDFSVKLCKAVTYVNDLYGGHERAQEWVTPPGSIFVFEKKDGGTYYFTQVE